MSFGNIYNVDTTAAFTGNAIEAVQSAIETEYDIDSVHYAKIVKCDMRSANPFEVDFNRQNSMKAVKMPSGEYGVTYQGGIDRIDFAESTTLTWFQVEWAFAGKTN